MLAAGQKWTYERTFTLGDVSAFAEVSGDRGVHHLVPDSRGRIMVQGLLTATLPTKLGGDLNYIARKMTFEFLRPVFVGDTITCESTAVKVGESEDRFDVSLTVACTNQEGKVVLRGEVEGIIRR